MMKTLALMLPLIVLTGASLFRFDWIDPAPRAFAIAPQQRRDVAAVRTLERLAVQVQRRDAQWDEFADEFVRATKPLQDTYKRRSLAKALNRMGACWSIRTMQPSIDPETAWLRQKDAIAYQCTLDYRALMQEAEVLVDTLYGDKIFRPMLAGLKHDAQGPKLDVQRDLIDRFTNEMVVVVDPNADTETGCALMVAIGLQDKLGVKRTVERVVKFESGAKAETVNGRQLFVVEILEKEQGIDEGASNSSDAKRANAISADAGNYLLIGDANLVRSVLRRR